MTVARAASTVDTNTQHSPQEIQLILGPDISDDNLGAQMQVALKDVFHWK